MTKKVLIVDDDDELSELIRELLTLEGYQVDLVDNGREAVQKLQDEPLPAVILLDVAMPVMNGLEFREEQLKHPTWALIPVVLMSGAYQLEETAEKANVAYILSKPPNIEEVISKVKDLAGPGERKKAG